MWLMLCWLVGLPKLLYHFVLTLPVLILYLFYRIFGPTQSAPLPNSKSSSSSSNTASSSSQAKLLTVIQQQGCQSFSQFQQSQRQLSGQVRDKMRSMMTRALSRSTQAQGNQSIGGVQNASGNANQRRDLRFYYLASLLLVGLICLSHWPMRSYCLEQDAEILKPVANLAKGIIKTVTLGVPLEVNFEPTGLVKNFAYFTWRTGFPVSMPKGFVAKAQDFYNRVKFRVDQTEVKDVERKSLADLKLDLDEIVDGIVDEVRQSPDGLYTDYLKTRVRNIPLEDASTAVGVQLKAYGVDLTNYRNIAGVVLGIPVMPTVASTMINVANLASIDAMRNLTQTFAPLNQTSRLLTQLPGSALKSVSSVSSSAIGQLNNLAGQQLPIENLVRSAAVSPLNLLRRQQQQQQQQQLLEQTA